MRGWEAGGVPHPPSPPKKNYLRSTRSAGSPSWQPGKQEGEEERAQPRGPKTEGSTGCPHYTPPWTPPCHTHLLAEVPDAPDLEGAGGLHVLQLHVDLGPCHAGQGQALQERGHEVEGPLGLHGRALPGVGVTAGVPKPALKPTESSLGTGRAAGGPGPQGYLVATGSLRASPRLLPRSRSDVWGGKAAR